MDILKRNNFAIKGIVEDVDLNTITTPGLYNATKGLTNSPEAAPWGVLLVLGVNDGYGFKIQLLIDQSGNIWVRRTDKTWKKSSNSN